MDNKDSSKVSKERKTDRSETILILVCICIICFVALFGTIVVHHQSKQTWEKSLQSLQTNYDGLKKRYSNLQSEYNTLESMYTVMSDADSEQASEQKSEPSADNQKGVECYSDEYIDIYYDHCGYEYGSSRIFFVVQNKTQVPLYLQFDSVGVDGWQLRHVVGGGDILPTLWGCIAVSVDDLSTYHPSTLSASFKLSYYIEGGFGDTIYTDMFSEINVNP